MVNSTFVTDAEFNGYIQSSYQELYGLITEKFGNDYFTQSPSTGYTFSTDGITQFFALPADFFKLLGVDLQVSAPGFWITLRPFAFSERNRLQTFSSSIPMAGQALRVFYVPRLTLPAADGDSVDGVNGWEEFIVADVCMKALVKEESDASSFARAKAEMLKRIESEAENRDAGAPATVADVRNRRAIGMAYRLNGNNLWLIGNGQPGWSYGDWGREESGWGW